MSVIYNFQIGLYRKVWVCTVCGYEVMSDDEPRILESKDGDHQILCEKS